MKSREQKFESFPEVPSMASRAVAALAALGVAAAGTGFPQNAFAQEHITPGRPAAPASAAKSAKPKKPADYEKAASAGIPFALLSKERGAALRASPEPNAPGSYTIESKARTHSIPGKEPGFVLTQTSGVNLEVVGPAKFTIVFFPWENEVPTRRGQTLTLQYTIDGVKYEQAYSLRGNEKVLYVQEDGGNRIALLAGISFPVELQAGAHRLGVEYGNHAGVFHIQGLQRGATNLNGTQFATDHPFEEDPDRPGEFTVGMYIQDNPAGSANPYTPKETSEPSVNVPDLSAAAVEKIEGRPDTVRVIRTSARGECIGKPYTYEGIASVGEEVIVRFKRVWPPVKSDPGARGPAEYPVDVAWGFDDVVVARLRAGALDAASKAGDARENARLAWAVINGTGGIKQQLDTADPLNTALINALREQLNDKTVEAANLETDAVAAEVAAREAWIKAASAEQQRFMVSPVFPDGPQPPADVTRAVCVIPGTVAAVRANVFQVGAAVDKPRAVYAASLDVGAETRTPADCLSAIRAQMRAATFNPANKLPNACLDKSASKLQRWRVTMKNRR